MMNNERGCGRLVKPWLIFVFAASLFFSDSGLRAMKGEKPKVYRWLRSVNFSRKWRPLNQRSDLRKMLTNPGGLGEIFKRLNKVEGKLDGMQTSFGGYPSGPSGGNFFSRFADFTDSFSTITVNSIKGVCAIVVLYVVYKMFGVVRSYWALHKKTDHIKKTTDKIKEKQGQLDKKIDNNQRKNENSFKNAENQRKTIKENQEKIEKKMEENQQATKDNFVKVDKKLGDLKDGQNSVLNALDNTEKNCATVIKREVGEVKKDLTKKIDRSQKENQDNFKKIQDGMEKNKKALTKKIENESKKTKEDIEETLTDTLNEFSTKQNNTLDEFGKKQEEQYEELKTDVKNKLSEVQKTATDTQENVKRVEEILKEKCEENLQKYDKIIKTQGNQGRRLDDIKDLLQKVASKRQNDFAKGAITSVGLLMTIFSSTKKGQCAFENFGFLNQNNIHLLKDEFPVLAEQVCRKNITKDITAKSNWSKGYPQEPIKFLNNLLSLPTGQTFGNTMNFSVPGNELLQITNS